MSPRGPWFFNHTLRIDASAEEGRAQAGGRSRAESRDDELKGRDLVPPPATRIVVVDPWEPPVPHRTEAARGPSNGAPIQDLSNPPAKKEAADDEFLGREVIGMPGRLRRRGSVMLAVVLFGVLMLSTGIVLVSVTMSTNRTSYGLNRVTVCRYAAEGALNGVMFRIAREAQRSSPGWFAQALRRPDPVLVEYLPQPLSASPLKLAGADSPRVEVSILDSSEVWARYKKVLATDQYLVRAKATLDGYSATLHLRLRYSASLNTVTKTLPSQLFSKYLLWTTSQKNSGNDVFVYSQNSDGYVHIEGDVLIGNKNARFGMPITASGTLDYLSPPFVATAWTPSERELVFDANMNGKVDGTARPERLNSSEADTKQQSGGGKPSVPQPSFNDVEARFLVAAKEQCLSRPALAALWIDRTNPLYAPGGALDVGAISGTRISLAHDPGTSKTTAYIQVIGSRGAKTTKVVLPPGVPTILLTPAPIQSLSGTYFANLTVASTYSGPPTMIEPYGAFHEPPDNLPRMKVLGSPAIVIDDHLINVDQNGTPKYWLQKMDPVVEKKKTITVYAEPILPVQNSGQPPVPANPKQGQKGSFLPRPPANLAGLMGHTWLWARLLLSPLLQASPGGGLVPSPTRLNLRGVPQNDVAGSNVDTDPDTWTRNGSRQVQMTPREPTQAEIDAHPGMRITSLYDTLVTTTTTETRFVPIPTYKASHPCALGIYSRGDTMIRTSRANHVGMFAFYGGDPRSRLYADPARANGNRAYLGSTVSPQTAISHYRVTNGSKIFLDQGFTRGKIASYDWDFLKNPPPFWIAPATVVDSSRTEIKVSFGSISSEND
jgi:hypothetical protein